MMGVSLLRMVCWTSYESGGALCALWGCLSFWNQRNEKNPHHVKPPCGAKNPTLRPCRLVKHGFLDELTCEFACACGIAPVVKRKFDNGYDHAQDTGYARFFLPMRRTLNISVVQARFDGATPLFRVYAAYAIGTMYSTPSLT